MTWQVLEADCVEAMRDMPEASVDAICTDPPYGLEFMGKEWDRIGARSLNPAMQANKAMSADEPEAGNPWASERTSYGTPKRNPRCRKCGKQKHNHPKSRCQCEVPSWDTEGWHYNFKMQEWHEAWATEALRVLKPGGHAVVAGGTRTFHRLVCALEDAGFEIRDCIAHMFGSGFPKSLNIGDGRGTALKPSFEPWTLARKPLIGTVRTNVERFGTGALNIDGTRIGDTKSVPASPSKRLTDQVWGKYGVQTGAEGGHDPNLGRWPANVALSHLPECERVGERRVAGSSHTQEPTDTGDTAAFGGGRKDGSAYGNAGGLETVEAWRCARAFSWRVEPEAPVGLHRLADAHMRGNGSAWVGHEGACGPIGSGPRDFQAGCPVCRRSGDALAQLLEADDRASAQRLDDALELVAHEHSRPHSPGHPHGDLPSTRGDSHLADAPQGKPASSISGESLQFASREQASRSSSKASAEPPPDEPRDSTLGSRTSEAVVLEPSISSRSCGTDAVCPHLAAIVLTFAASHTSLVVAVDEGNLCPVAELDRQSGERSAGGSIVDPASVPGTNTYGEWGRHTWDGYGDTGGASRFFYVAKSSRAERTAGVGANAHPT